MPVISEPLAIARTRIITVAGVPYLYAVGCGVIGFFSFIFPMRAIGHPIIAAAICIGVTFIVWAAGYEITRRRPQNLAIIAHHFLTRRHQRNSFNGRIYDSRK